MIQPEIPVKQLKNLNTVPSSKLLYHRLDLLGQPSACLHFKQLATLGKNPVLFHFLCGPPHSSSPWASVWIQMPNTFPGGSMVKESICQFRRCSFDPWVRRIPWRRHWQPTPVFFLEKFHGERILVYYSPWDLQELDVTEHTEYLQCQCGEREGKTTWGLALFLVLHQSLRWGFVCWWLIQDELSEETSEEVTWTGEGRKKKASQNLTLVLREALECKLHCRACPDSGKGAGLSYSLVTFRFLLMQNKEQPKECPSNRVVGMAH